MIAEALRLLTLLAAVGAGIVGGVFFAFSNFVMRALVRLPPRQGAAAMRAINVTVLNPGFLGVFAGTMLASVGLALAALLRWPQPGSREALLAALLYVIGCFGVTMFANVPRNEQLEATEPEASDAAEVWAGYQTSWTWWNHVRTAASIAAAVLYILAFCEAA